MKLTLKTVDAVFGVANAKIPESQIVKWNLMCKSDRLNELKQIQQYALFLFLFGLMIYKTKIGHVIVCFIV